MRQIDWDELYTDIVGLLNAGTEPTIAALARELGLNAETLRVGMRREYGIAAEDLPGLFKEIVTRGTISKQAVFKAIKNNGMTVIELADKFNVAPKVIHELLMDMIDEGFAISKTAKKFEVNTNWSKEMLPEAPSVLTDLVDEHIIFGVFSDTHFASKHAQISAWRAYMKEAYEAGVRVFLFIGDLTCGIRGYRGQEHDVVPGCYPTNHKDNHVASKNQAELSQMYLESLDFFDDIEIFMIGGNHDWWHVVNSGVDVVKLVADEYSNVHYLGYDEFDLRLTDQITARLWHPSGGIPYARSYRIQKGMENLAYEILFEEAGKNSDGQLGFIFAGHLHIEAKVQIGGVVGSQVPCFEGRSDYLKRKGLYPVIGGQIWEVDITSTGKIASTVYTLKLFEEIIDDWKNYPTVELEEEGYNANYERIVFSGK